MALDLIDVFTLAVALAGLIVAIIVAARQGKNIDQETAGRLERMSDPATMERLERAYQSANEERKQFVKLASALLGVIAPLTPFKSDDAAAALLMDIQQPGSPAPVPPAGNSPAG